MTTGGSTDARSSWPHPMPELRLAPVPPDQREPATEELLESLRIRPDQPVANIFSTIAHHPRLLKRWSAMGGVLLFRGELDPRERELLILRTAWNCRAGYEWAHHIDFGHQVGLTDDEIARIGEGPQDAGWSGTDATLLRAADELHQQARIGDDTWAELAGRYRPAQLVEICMLVGQYHLVAFTLNSLGVQLEPEHGGD
ncbi:MAG: carboxymuconolactone decarboxylase family protein [Acidimicrobiales bacterium]